MERKVLLICAGGMSTGILMRKMEKYAEAVSYTHLYYAETEEGGGRK